MTDPITRSFPGEYEVKVSTGARLHFGPLAVGAVDRPSFGGVGLMVDSPGFTIRLRHLAGDESIIEGPDADRIGRILEKLTAAHFPGCEIPVQVTVDENIPRHGGLGSGTQLALALATGLATLSTQAAGGVTELAAATGRGQRSAVGVYGFRDGGLILDSGKESPDSLGQLGERVSIPANWRFLLWTPEGEGLSGVDEGAAFAAMSPMSAQLSDQLTTLATTQLLPAANSQNFKAFSSALWEFGTLVGEYFTPSQGGVFSHPQAKEVVAMLQEAGVTGIAQSSWGPTICAVLPDEMTAITLLQQLPLSANTLRLTRPRNRGAEVHAARC